MSMFLPESGAKTLEQPGVAQPTNPDVTDDDLKLMQRVLSAASRYPNMIPDQFMAYLMDYVQTSGLVIPIGQVFGFAGFTAQQANSSSVDAAVSATVYANFTADGPELSGLSAGRYLIVVSCDIQAVAGAFPRMGYSVNGAAPDDTASCACQVSGGYISVSKPSLVTLTADANTLTSQRKIDAAVGSANFGFRSITALRYDNL